MLQDVKQLQLVRIFSQILDWNETTESFVIFIISYA